ncbi:trimeric intracellular cation channel family protein [Granulicoccus sp. GXG6511]|uniref:trimeric intracellular cation channel family protein n=1 Tax=Granulicoccus sp. GXG6511 TaxID=3381351 RepID=UPI003D7C47E7
MNFDTDLLFRLVDVFGVFANAVLGGAVARTKGFDAIGFVILAICSGLGGGMLRDVLLGVGFPVALTDPLYLSSALVGAGVAFVLDFGRGWARRALLVGDALAMGCWSATGAAKALGAGLAWLPAIFLGVITAVGGGMLRDILVNQVPSVFNGPLYATVSAIASAEMVLLRSVDQYALGMGLAILTGGVLGLLARWRQWTLPAAAQWTVPRPRVRKLFRSRARPPKGRLF